MSKTQKELNALPNVTVNKDVEFTEEEMLAMREDWEKRVSQGMLKSFVEILQCKSSLSDRQRKIIYEHVINAIRYKQEVVQHRISFDIDKDSPEEIAMDIIKTGKFKLINHTVITKDNESVCIVNLFMDTNFERRQLIKDFLKSNNIEWEDAIHKLRSYTAQKE